MLKLPKSTISPCEKQYKFHKQYLMYPTLKLRTSVLLQQYYFRYIYLYFYVSIHHHGVCVQQYIIYFGVLILSRLRKKSVRILSLISKYWFGIAIAIRMEMRSLKNKIVF